MNNSTFIFLLVSIVFITISQASFSQKLEEISSFVTRIKEAEKVERLYTIRYGLDKINEQTNLTIAEQRELSNVYLLLANSFKSRNHYRNAVDVYFDYLDLKESYRTRYINFIADSIHQVYLKTASAEANKIAALDNEIEALNRQSDEVTGMKKKYISTGSLATLILLAVAGMIFMNRNRAIKNAEKQLGINQLELRSLYKTACDASMQTGSIGFAKNAVNENSSIIAELTNALDGKTKTSNETEGLKILKMAGEKLVDDPS